MSDDLERQILELIEDEVSHRLQNLDTVRSDMVQSKDIKDRNHSGELETKRQDAQNMLKKVDTQV